MTADQPAEFGVLKNMAYRYLGSVADAEDAAQEAFARWFALPAEARDRIESPIAWLVTTVSRIALDVLRSARARRETYVGEWLPEPVAGNTSWTSLTPDIDGANPSRRAELRESASMAFLIVCESMTPAERIAFVLHDVFDYRFGEIAEILGKTPAACRQLASTGRRRMRAGTKRAPDTTAIGPLVDAFGAAWRSGDAAALLRHLDPEATVITDSDGVVPATRLPVHGAADVVAALLAVPGRFPGLSIDRAPMGGETALVARAGDGSVIAVVTVRWAGDAIDHLWVMRNPAKLGTWA